MTELSTTGHLGRLPGGGAADLVGSEEELSSGEAGAAPLGPSRQAKAPSPEQRRQRRRLGVVGLVIVAAIGFLVFKGITSAIVFFKTANEAVAQRVALGNSTFQLEGMVLPGTVHTVRAQAGTRVSFVVESSGVKVAVTNTGSPPQLFQPGIPVIVVGHFVGSSDRFASDQILVKHSNSYIAAYPNRVKALNGTKR
ncbi:MAG: cytochrome c maturation protein CcmE [Acidimicrobiales bacterium]|jgi:cytochrome c-type biogenesis protein CcmE